MLRRSTPLAVILLAAAALAGCSSTLDAAETEDVIRKAVVEQVGSEVRGVSCPEDVEAKAGDTFECTVTGADGSKGQAKVTQRDDEGNVRVTAPFLHTPNVEELVVDGIQEQTGAADVTLTCPDIVEAKAGARFECTAEAGEQAARVSVTQQDAEGNVRWEITDTAG